MSRSIKDKYMDYKQSSNEVKEIYQDVHDSITFPISMRSSNTSSPKKTMLTTGNLETYRKMRPTSVLKHPSHWLRENLTSPSSSLINETKQQSPWNTALQLMKAHQFSAAIPYFTQHLEAITTSNSGRILASNTAGSSELQVYYQRGVCQYEAQRYHEAIEDISHVIMLTPMNGKLFAKRAMARAKLNHHSAAIDDYTQAIELAANDSIMTELRTLYIARALVYKTVKDYTNAFQDLNYAEKTENGDRDAEIYYYRAEMYIKLNQYIPALKELDRHIELQEEKDVIPQMTIVHDQTPFIHTTLNKSTSSERMEKLVDTLHQRIEVLMKLANKEEENYRKDQELEATEMGTMKKINTIQYSAPQTMVYIDRIILDYGRIIRLSKNPLNALKERGELYAKLGQFERAMSDFDEAFQLDTTDFTVPIARAKCYEAQHKDREAINEMTQVLQNNGYFVDALFYRAKLYCKIGDLTKARADYTRIINVQLDDANQGADLDSTGVVDNGNDTKKKRLGSTRSSFINNDALRKSSPSNLGTSSAPIRSALLRRRKPNSSSSPKTTSGSASRRGNSSSTANGYSNQVEVTSTFTNDYAVQALLLRARLAAEEFLFDIAIDDCNRILAFDPKHLDANLELQSITKKKDEFEKEQHDKALEWLYMNEKKEEEAQKSGNTSGGASSKKKKKKKKKKKEQLDDNDSKVFNNNHVNREENQSSLAPPPNLDDDESQDNVINAENKIAIVQYTSPEASDAIESSDKDVADAEEYFLREEEKHVSANHVVGEEISQGVIDTTSGAISSEKPTNESQWNKLSNDSEIQNGIELPDQSQSSQIYEEMADVTLLSTSDTHSPTQTSHTREVRFDGKYLKKRQRQLEKLREQFQQAWEEQDVLAMDVALERAERKQMTESLANEIHQVKLFMEELAEKKRSEKEITEDRGEGDASNKLAIRPIAYSQALQAAEQNQAQLHRYECLLNEKNELIKSLQELLQQHQENDKFSASCVSLPDDTLQFIHSIRMSTTENTFVDLNENLKNAGFLTRVDELINHMGPSAEAELIRNRILSFLSQILESHFSSVIPGQEAPWFISTGSFPLKTYLPGADLDICLILPCEMMSTWSIKVLQALCLGEVPSASVYGPHLRSSYSGSGQLSGTLKDGVEPPHRVRNVSWINAQVQVVKCTVDNMSVDISCNQTGALSALMLIDTFDSRINYQHLLKRSIVLIKAWCIHESSQYLSAASNNKLDATSATQLGTYPPSVLGASQGGLSTYAVNTIVMGIFNKYGSRIRHPLIALYLFLDEMAEFPWHEAAMTIYGRIPLAPLSSSPVGTIINDMSQKNNNSDNINKMNYEVVTTSDIDRIRALVHQTFPPTSDAMSSPNLVNSTTPMRYSNGFKSPLFPLRVCNIVDPLDDTNNLARSLSIEWLPQMKRAFQFGRNRVAAILHSVNNPNSELGELDNLFQHSWSLYGRGDGWRPDLLVHPRQVWHSKTNHIQNDNERKWESNIIRELDSSLWDTMQFPDDVVGNAKTMNSYATIPYRVQRPPSVSF